MTTQTLESQPLNAKVAISTPQAIDYAEVVRKCAQRKADNGAQFTSTKGKATLQVAVNNTLYSLLGIAKHDANNNVVQLPDDVFAKAKAAVNAFWHNEARDIVQAAIDNDAKINVRRGVLMTRISAKGELVRSKTDKITAVYAPKAHEVKLCDTFGLTAAKQRMDTMLDNVGKYSREELQAQRNKIALLETALKG